MQLEALNPLASNRVAEIVSKEQIADQPSVEVADKDDLLEGDDGGVVQLGHDGRLPLQVLGDVGAVDLAQRHHLRCHLLVQDDSSTRCTLPKDHFPRVVGVSL